jgi:hypothetical protein
LLALILGKVEMLQEKKNKTKPIKAEDTIGQYNKLKKHMLDHLFSVWVKITDRPFHG